MAVALSSQRGHRRCCVPVVVAHHRRRDEGLCCAAAAERRAAGAEGDSQQQRRHCRLGCFFWGNGCLLPFSNSCSRSRERVPSCFDANLCLLPSPPFSTKNGSGGQEQRHWPCPALCCSKKNRGHAVENKKIIPVFSQLQTPRFFGRPLHSASARRCAEV